MAGNGYATTSRKKILEYLMANSDHTVTVTDIDQYLKIFFLLVVAGGVPVCGDGASLRGTPSFEMCFLRMHHSFGMCIHG